jgi:hypothetical protein
MADIWDVVGALAGTGGTLVAAAAIWGSARNSRAEARRADAVELRRDMKTYRVRFERLSDEARSGSLLAMSVGVAARICDHFSIQSTADLGPALKTLDGHPLLLGRFLEEDMVANRFLRELYELEAADIDLSARLRIFGETTHFLRSVGVDCYSYSFFKRLFDPALHHVFFEGLEASASRKEIELKLASVMIGNAAHYFHRAWSEVAEAVSEFVDVLYVALINLSDSQLWTLQERLKAFPDPRIGDNRIQRMREFLRVSKSIIGTKRASGLVALIDKLEVAAAKG